MKDYKRIVLTSWIYLVLLTGVEIAHLFTLLNPHMAISTLPFTLLVVKIVIVEQLLFLPLLIVLLMKPGALTPAWVLIPLAMLVLFIVQNNTAGRFLNRSMGKVFAKEIYALGLLFLLLTVLAFRLRRTPRRVLLIAFVLLAAVHAFQYDRRDSMAQRRPLRHITPPPATSPVRVCVILTRSTPFATLAQSAETRDHPALTRLWEEGTRGRLHRFHPTRHPAPLWVSLYTGVYPYRHRIFAPEIREDPLLPGIDLFPLVWPPLPSTRSVPADYTRWKSPAIWTLMQKASISCALYNLPYLPTPPTEVSRAVTPGGCRPSSQPPEADAANFILSNPASFQMVFTPPGRGGRTLDRTIQAAFEVFSTKDQIIVIDPVDGRWFLHWGLGVARGEITTETRVADIVPTLLFVASLPLPRYLDGRILLEDFTHTFATSRVITVIWQERRE